VRIFLLPVTPMKAVSRRSRMMMTHRCRSSEEAHSLLG
jgi:hypothetical protein